MEDKLNDYGYCPCYAELIAIIVIGGIHVATELAISLTAAKIYNGVVSGGFLIYLGWRTVKTKNILRAWGMRIDNFWTALRSQLIFVIPAAMLVYGVGLAIGSVSFPKTFWLVLGLYPVWGIVQQFALQNLIAKNLRFLLPHPIICALSSAVLFGLAHFPCMSLMALALLAGFFFTLIYQRNPNLWAVGIVHGFLGAIIYYILLRENPGAEILEFFKFCLNTIYRLSFWTRK